MALQITITEAGKAEVINAANNGTAPVLITAVGLGTGKYAPDPTQTALQSETKQLSTIAGQAVSSDTIHVTIKDETTDVYSVSEIGLYTDSGTLFAVYSDQLNAFMQKTAESALMMSVDIIIGTLDATNLTFGDTSFSNPPASETVSGVAKIANLAEAIAGTDDIKIMSPLKVKQKVDNAINDLINGSPGALDTLNELAQALGDDPNFATTITNALAGKSDLTWIKSLGLGDTGTTYISDLNAATTGGKYAFNIGTLNAPFNYGTLDVQVRGGGEVIQIAREHNGAEVQSRKRLGAGTFTTWTPEWNNDNCPSSLNISGYQKLRSGLIKQWGYLSVGTGAPTMTITLPISFPTAFIGANLTIKSSTIGTSERNPRFWGETLSNFQANFGNADVVDAYWEAIGY
ncbi:MAG: hypothetical protein DSZ27_07335 [Thiomicrospira sp.]|nr:MAG: hypothetical protein DSZ27_07335 [Thiomicrospira sp.]